MARCFFSLLVFLIPLLTAAFSTGAGGCSGGEPAVGATHLGGDRSVQSSGLSEAGISVTIDAVELSPTQPIDVPVGSDLVVTIDSSSITYLGALVRLEAPNGVDTSTALSPAVNMQDANVCVSPIAGITHENSNEKSLSTGMLRFDEAVNGVFLDITVVFSNNAQQGSIFAYDRMEVNFVEDSTLANDTTQAPTRAPTQTTPATSTVAPTPSPGTTAVPTVQVSSASDFSLVPSTAAPSQRSPPSFISIDGTSMNMRMNMMAQGGRRMMMMKGKKGMKMMGTATKKKGGKKQRNDTKKARVNRRKQHNQWFALDSSVSTWSPSRGIFGTRTQATHAPAATNSHQMMRTGLFSPRYRTGPFLEERENI